jgi:DNA-binding transcriptional LysR family regulator
MLWSLERLRVLDAVASYGSITAAAEALHVTTSAVSQQLAKLEREAGTQLVQRSGRGIRLTEAAELLAGHAASILSLAERAQADIDAYSGTVTGRLIIASLPTASRGLAAPALRLLRNSHPDLGVSLTEADSGEAIELVERGGADLAIVHDWTNAPLPVPEGLARTLLLEDVADIAVPAAHPLAGRPGADLAEFGPGPWICGVPGTSCHDWLSFTLRSQQAEPVFAHTANEYATQLALVAAGLGIAVMPRLGREPVPEGVGMVTVLPALRRRIYAMWREASARRPAIRATATALRTVAKQQLDMPQQSHERGRGHETRAAG